MVRTKNFSFYPGMGFATAKRTILRPKGNGWESWKDVAKRVSLGNALLTPGCKKDDGTFELTPEAQEEFEQMYESMRTGALLMSGRHLQHGDESQPYRNLEVFSNCSTSPTSFTLFYLLLNGSGVGRLYDDDFILIDWDNAPTLRCVLDSNHPDFDYSAHESVRDAKHKYGNGRDVMWFEVPDTREGWAKAVEIYELAAFEKIHKDKMLILDFSKVRCKGSPIRGMQSRPASGPVPLMNALMKLSGLKGAKMAPWMQAMYVDHYLAECVLVGGARRAARIAVKFWKDKTILDFINIKRPIEFTDMKPEDITKFRMEGNHANSFLWSANNSVGVDSEFWSLLDLKRGDEKYNEPDAVWARKVFKEVTRAAYYDGTGEPGFINLDKLRRNDEGIGDMYAGDYVGSSKYQINEETSLLMSRLAKRAKRLKYNMITNPCQPGWALVLTRAGLRQIKDVNVGDEIWSSMDGWVEVINKQSSGIKDVYRYRTNAGVFYGTEDHRVMSGGEKVAAKDAETIQRSVCDYFSGIKLDAQTIMDGLVLGDGSVHKASNNLVHLYIGAGDQDYFDSEISGLIIKHRPGIKQEAYEIETTITFDEIPETFDRSIPRRFLEDVNKLPSLLRGLFSANGSVIVSGSGCRITLKTASSRMAEDVQIALSVLGISSYITKNKPKVISFDNGDYLCKESYDINITTHKKVFMDKIGFLQKYKNEKLEQYFTTERRTPAAKKIDYPVNEVDYISTEEVFDITVSGPNHVYYTGGCEVSNCGEVSLFVLGGYCIIADLAPFYCSTIDEFERATRAGVRALIRVNLMDSFYHKETKRTNRIGLGITGVHEFAYKFFGLTFNDLVDEEKSKEFWEALGRVSAAAKDEAIKYSQKLGVSVPHTVMTVKPSGCGTMSTEIRTTEGNVTFQQLFDRLGVQEAELQPHTWFDISHENIFVFDKDNNEQKITKLFCNGRAYVYEITFEDGKTYEFTAEHKFLTKDRGWVPTADLTAEDEIIQF